MPIAPTSPTRHHTSSPNKYSRDIPQIQARKRGITTSPPLSLAKRINIPNQRTRSIPPTHTASNGNLINAAEAYHNPSLAPISKIFRADRRRTIPKRTIALLTPGPTPTNKRHALSPPSSPLQHQPQYPNNSYHTNILSPNPTTPTLP